MIGFSRTQTRNIHIAACKPVCFVCSMCPMDLQISPSFAPAAGFLGFFTRSVRGLNSPAQPLFLPFLLTTFSPYHYCSTFCLASY